MSTLQQLFLAIIFALVSIPVHALQKINVIGEHFPPYQFEKNGNIEGFSIDLINALTSETKLAMTFSITPWARAYHIAKTEANTLLLTINRTTAREKHFKWVTSISRATPYLWALKKINAQKSR